MTKNLVLLWEEDVEDHDYDAADAYLSLRYSPETAKLKVQALRKQDGVRHARANDILRAARLEPAPLGDPGILKDLRRIARGHALSPVLLVNPSRTDFLEIADGYHRVSLSWHLDPFSDVPHRLA